MDELFTAAEWSPDSTQAAFVAADCFGNGSVGFGYDVRAEKRLRLDEVPLVGNLLE